MLNTPLSVLARLLGRRRGSSEEPPTPVAASPREALAALVQRLDDAISASEQALAEAVNAARSLESRQHTASESADHWTDKLRQAEARRSAAWSRGASARQLAALDDLVKAAAKESVSAERLSASLQPRVDEQSLQLKAMRVDLEKLRRTREDLQDRRSELIARSSLAEAEAQVASVLADIAAGNPTSELTRIESEVRAQEAAADGKKAVAALADPGKAFDDEFDRLTAAHDSAAHIESTRKESK